MSHKLNKNVRAEWRNVVYSVSSRTKLSSHLVELVYTSWSRVQYRNAAPSEVRCFTKLRNNFNLNFFQSTSLVWLHLLTLLRWESANDVGATCCLNESCTFILYGSAEKQTFYLNTRWNRKNKLLIHQNKNLPLKYKFFLINTNLGVLLLTALLHYLTRNLFHPNAVRGRP